MISLRSAVVHAEDVGPRWSALSEPIGNGVSQPLHDSILRLHELPPIIVTVANRRFHGNLYMTSRVVMEFNDDVTLTKSGGGLTKPLLRI